MSINKNQCTSNEYLPNARTGYKPEAHSLESNSPEGITSKLPSPVEDDIAVNNIACQEFDYTEKSYVDSILETNP